MTTEAEYKANAEHKLQHYVLTDQAKGQTEETYDVGKDVDVPPLQEMWGGAQSSVRQHAIRGVRAERKHVLRPGEQQTGARDRELTGHLLTL